MLEKLTPEQQEQIQQMIMLQQQARMFQMMGGMGGMGMGGGAPTGMTPYDPTLAHAKPSQTMPSSWPHS